MSDEFFVLLFDIEGRAETYVPANANTSEAEDPRASSEQNEMETVAKLKGATEIICEKIEREVKKLVPPYVTVQANVQFDMGSILMTGTVALFSWAGAIVLEVAKEEVQHQLAKLVKLGAQRAFSRFLSTENLHRSVGVMDMSVTSQPLSLSPRKTAVNATGVTPQSQSISTVGRSGLSAPRLANATAIYVAVGVILLLQVVLLLERFFDITFTP